MIIIDSNTWIFAEDMRFEAHELAAKKIQQVLSTEQFGMNAIIVSEVFHILSERLGIGEAHSRVLKILQHPLMQWLELSDLMVIDAINLSMRDHVKINDALIAEQTMRFNAKLLTDNLKDFKKIKGLEIIPLR